MICLKEVVYDSWLRDVVDRFGGGKWLENIVIHIIGRYGWGIG